MHGPQARAVGVSSIHRQKHAIETGFEQIHTGSATGLGQTRIEARENASEWFIVADIRHPCEPKTGVIDFPRHRNDRSTAPPLLNSSPNKGT